MGRVERGEAARCRPDSDVEAMHASQAGEGDDFQTALLVLDVGAAAAASALLAVMAENVAVAVLIAETPL